MKFFTGKTPAYQSAFAAFLLLLACASFNPSPGNNFVRGDCNANGSIGVDDAALLLNFSFNGAPAPCHSALDFDGNSNINILDSLGLLGFLFTQGTPPVAPFPDCAKLFIPDGLGCNSFNVCPPTPSGHPIFANTVIRTANINSTSHLAHLNSDGFLDLVHTNRNIGTISVFLTHGDSSYGQAQRYAVGQFPDAIDSADMNADGFLDLIVCNRASDNVSLLYGNAQGEFSAPSTISVGTFPIKAKAHDLNQDGRPDIVCINALSNDMSIAQNLGNGLFGATMSIPLALTPADFHVGFVNQDALSDVVILGESNGIASIHLGSASGLLETAITQAIPNPHSNFRLVDVDDDQILDLVFGKIDLYLMRGNGDGTFAAPQVSFLGSQFNNFELGDLNKDGAIDLVTCNLNNTITVAFGDALGNFFHDHLYRSNYDFSGPKAAVNLWDINSDSKLDLIVSSHDQIHLSLGIEQGRFSTGIQYNQGEIVRSLYKSDFNNDGQLDLATTDTGSHHIRIQLSDGAGNFVVSHNIPTPPSMAHLNSGDFNNDGNLDLVTTNYDAQFIAVILGNGDGSFQAPIETPTVDEFIPHVDVADFNNDGNLDIVYAEAYQNRVTIQLGIGNGSFGNAQHYVSDQEPRSVKARDINHDGLLDLLVINTHSASIGVHLGQGNGQFMLPVDSYIGNHPEKVELADLNCDGQLDVVASAEDVFSDEFGFTVAFGRGDASFSPPLLYNVGDSSSPPKLADMNGDGFDDILISRGDIDQVFIFYNDGHGYFPSPSIFQVPAYWANSQIRLLPADFDNDGDIDLISTNHLIRGFLISENYLLP